MAASERSRDDELSMLAILAVREGELRLVTSLEKLPVPSGPKQRRLGLAAAKFTS